jgi:N-acetylneuraminate synthase
MWLENGIRIINLNSPTYFIAELSCNHNGDKDIAYKLIDEAHKACANAIKLQTYTPDTITIKCDKPIFKDCLKGSIWEGQTLYDLYSVAYTPWEWHKELKDYANSKGLDLFSSPFDVTAVDFLESLDVPAYKIASFEITDHILIKKIAQTKKPVLISSGMASLSELNDAVSLLREHGTTQIAMLKCTSAYPAKPEEFNLREIKNLADEFKVIVGLSDHTIGNVVAISSVILGAAIIEKHLTLNRMNNGLDDSFSSEPEEFKLLCQDVEDAWKSLGQKSFERCNGEKENIKYRKSLYFIADLNAGDIITEKSIRSVRPGYGIKPKFFNEIIGKRVRNSVKKFTPVLFELIED